jgi:TolB-like protein/Flp pilus assembly protein TadD
VTTQLELLRSALADRYGVERELGRGGMATVYLARDLKHDREVALKVLRPDIAASLGAERFVREIRVAAHLQHPHILPLYDSGEAAGFLYYVMPRVKGQSLRERLAAGGELPVPEAMRIVREVADALAYAHREGVVHRDIKPDNVMLADRHAMVMDFGVAKAVSEATGREGITTVGVALGTPAYMAPEQATADPLVDHRADIYALGVMAYEMLTGQPPFIGSTAQALLAAHATQAPGPVTARRATVPQALSDAIGKCLEKSPADRFQTADELLPLVESVATSSGGAPPVTAAIPGASGRRRYLLPVLGATAALVAVIGFFGLVRGKDAGAGRVVNPKSLAVLPFTSIQSDEESVAFATGLHDDLLTQLSKIADLKVISRTSVLEYANTTKNVREIARELGVAHVLEGNVQRAGNRVRLNAQLIDAEADVHLWAETYNRELSVDDIFAIQSDLAQRIASALQATMLPEEQGRIDAVPTNNLRAYDAYLRGREFSNRPGYRPANFAAAEQWFGQAVDLDPQFALALAALSEIHSRTYWFAFDRSDERRAEALRTAQRAQAIDPNLPEGHLALGYYYYYGHRDYERAMREFEVAERGLPGNDELAQAKGYVQRRMGLWDASMASLEKAAALNPRSAEILFNLGASEIYLGRYAEATADFDRALAIAPDYVDARMSKEVVIFTRDGNPRPLRTFLAGLSPEEGTLMPVPQAQWTAAVVDRDFAAAATVSGGNQEHVEDQVTVWPISLFHGLGHLWGGAVDRAEAALDSARAFLEEERRTSPDDPRVLTTLALAYAGLGRGADAVRAGRRAVELLPVSRGAVVGPTYSLHLAMVYAMVGEIDAALEELERYLSRPHQLSTHVVQRLPAFDALHDDPRFQELLARFPY